MAQGRDRELGNALVDHDRDVLFELRICKVLLCQLQDW
jgi:hypothetical protein